MNIIRIFFNFSFLAEHRKAKKNHQKISLIVQQSFTQKASLILRTSTHSTLKKICSRNTAKSLSHFTHFPGNMFLVGVRKDICTASFLYVQEMHSWITLKANVCIFLYISVRKFLFLGRRKLLSSWGWEEWLNHFLKATHCLGLVKCFTIFHCNWNF